MGQCLSNGGAATELAPAHPPKDTELVLLPTGELREYPRPATAARVLGDFSAADGWFLCDSDRMGFEGAVAAVGGAEFLRAGRIYFVLPADALRRSLRSEEVAALAVKASAALAAKASSASGTGSRRRRGAAVAPLIFAPTEKEEKTAVDLRNKAVPAAGKRRRPAARSRKPSRRFAPDLTAIPEGELSE
ncbi:hypothetical protein EJB05_14381, partial [Eragrostis curvula]